MKKPLTTFVSQLWMSLLGRRNTSQEPTDLGEVWSTRRNGRNDDDHHAVQLQQHCRSIISGSADRVRVCFRNRCDFPLILCWVDQDAKPYHFYRLDPTAEIGCITKDDHIEQTMIGHAFILAYVRPKTNEDDTPAETNEEAVERIRKLRSLDEVGVARVAGYRPKKKGVAKKDQDDDGEEDDDPGIWCPHLVEISTSPKIEDCRCGGPFLRGTVAADNKRVKQDEAVADDSVPQFELAVSISELDRTPLDTTSKQYKEMMLGGWPVRLDVSLTDDTGNLTAEERIYLRELEEDLHVLCLRLPEHARQTLSKDTPVWINRSLSYGPAACPLRGKGCCFHPDENWLTKNGCNSEKNGCVEIYDLKHYHSGRHLWGVGGVMIHEYSHAYHYKCLEGRYKNRQLEECFECAMRDKLYDCVRVKGSQGPTAKAYACSNVMEYWAELSAAFLGGVSSDMEYNKWYPFNRAQIKEHDPRAYRLLHELWKVKSQEEEGGEG